MRQHRRIPQEKRLALVGLEKVVNRLQALPANLEPLVTMAAAALWIAMRHAGGEAALCKISFPPFARLEANVALFGEQLGQRWRAANVPEHLTPISSFWRIVAGHQ